jgi:hypothetical protein
MADAAAPTQLARELHQLGDKAPEVMQRLNAASAQDIIEAVPYLYNRYGKGPELEAIRDAAVAIIGAKLTATHIAAVDRLNRSTTFLTVVNIIVGTIVSVAGIVIPLLRY